jgi:hypothetical protein
MRLNTRGTCLRQARWTSVGPCFCGPVSPLCGDDPGDPHPLLSCRRRGDVSAHAGGRPLCRVAVTRQRIVAKDRPRLRDGAQPVIRDLAFRGAGLLCDCAADRAPETVRRSAHQSAYRRVPEDARRQGLNSFPPRVLPLSCPHISLGVPLRRGSGGEGGAHCEAMGG